MPRVIGGHPADRWENEVFKALKNQLPNDWVIMPSVKWTLKKNGYVRDGEADFVILAPGSGMVVLEVKGSREFKVSEDGTWRRKERGGGWVNLKEAPPEQATRNMYDLVDVLTNTYSWDKFPGGFSYLVVYPQGKADTLPSMFDESTIATHRHMNQLTSRLRNALEKRCYREGWFTKSDMEPIVEEIFNKPSSASHRDIIRLTSKLRHTLLQKSASNYIGDQFTESVVESIIDHLKNRQFRVSKVDTAEDVASDYERIEELTQQQFASLRGLFQLPKVAIMGPAGSGKTVLAIWRLQALIDQGEKAIYICYNRALADSLRLRNPDYADFIWNVDRLFIHFCPEAIGMAGQSSFHREQLPCLVMDKADNLGGYDAILVDEGQDFSEEQLIALLDLLNPEGAWAFFADWKQDLYGAGKGAPIGAEVVFHLHYNCRNTKKINDTSNIFLGYKIDSMVGTPKGVRPLIESSRDQAKRAWELASQWSGEGSIAILSPYKYENSAMKSQKIGHGPHLSTDIRDLGKKDAVFYSTIKSFKGIEAASIIVVDLDIPGKHVALTEEDLYVACTRATTRLALLTSKKNVAEHFEALV